MQTPITQAGELPGSNFERCDLVTRIDMLLGTSVGGIDAGSALQIIASSLLSAPDEDFAGAGEARGALLGWQVRRVSAYIEANIAGRIRVSDLSAVVQRSEAHFARAFKRTFGLGPHTYIIRYRVHKACQMMEASNASLTEIALACGLSDQPHLCKLFRQIIGYTPAAWRRGRRAQVPSHHGTPLTAVPAWYRSAISA